MDENAAAKVARAMEDQRDWITSPQLAEKLGIPTKTVSSNLSRLADYGRIVRIRAPGGGGHPNLYRTKKIIERGAGERNIEQRKIRLRELMDAHLLGQITVKEFADALEENRP